MAKKTEAPPDARKRTVDICKELGNKEEYAGLTVMDATTISNVPTMPSGILSLDLILGGGPPPGTPRGRILELFGSEGSGKTTACLHMVAEAQRNGGIAAFVDVEHAIDLSYAQRLGVDCSTLLFQQPDSGESALNTVQALTERMKSGDIIIVDSVANLVPQAELDGEMGDSHVGLQARLMSQALRKLTGLAARTGVTIVFINQIRMRIGVTYGNPETTSGGKALKFYASQRIEVKPHKRVTKGDVAVGQIVGFNVVKNKIAPPFRKAEIELRFGEGFLRHIDVAHLAVSTKVFEKDGAYYNYCGERIGHGLDKVADFLKERPDFMKKIESVILMRYGYAA